MICHSPTTEIDQSRNQKRTALVLWITLITMAVEIVAGYSYGSMALLSDGIHMGTHAMALGIAYCTYKLADRFKRNSNFAFGTHKMSALGAYTSAITLVFAALTMIWESAERWINPVEIDFNQAIFVAVLGLLINLICAYILKDEPHDHGHHHGHTHSHAHDNHQAHSHDHEHAHTHAHHEDHNLKAAYIHVLTDAMTSVFAIASLIFAKQYGWLWLDAAAGILGAVLILKWAWGLLKKTGALLLDFSSSQKARNKITEIIQTYKTLVLTDLHIWEFGNGEKALICRIEGPYDQNQKEDIKHKIAHAGHFAHMTVEFTG